MSRFIEGEDRSQATLLPEYLDDAGAGLSMRSSRSWT